MESIHKEVSMSTTDQELVLTHFIVSDDEPSGHRDPGYIAQGFIAHVTSLNGW